MRDPGLSGRPRLPLTCVLLTLNEECNLDTALASLAPAAQVIVVDCGSTDQTVSIAERHGAQLIEREWQGFSAQRNWALGHPAVEHDWVLFLDADEVVPEDAWAEIEEFLGAPGGARAADFRREVWMFGRYLRHGGFSSARVTRLLHRTYCRFLDRPVHEHAVVDGGVRSFSSPLLHHDRKPFAAWLDRHNRYSSLEAAARLTPPPAAKVGGARAVKGWIRAEVWPVLPAKPLLFFLYVYVARLGFLDGAAGLRISALYGFQELSVQIKLEELRAAAEREC